MPWVSEFVPPKWMADYLKLEPNTRYIKIDWDELEKADDPAAKLFQPILATVDLECTAATKVGGQCRRPVGKFGGLHRDDRAPEFLRLCGQHAKQYREWLKTLDDRVDDHYERQIAELQYKIQLLTAKVDAADEAVSVVYYLRREDGLIKIGFSARFRNRIIALTKEHGPLEVMTTHMGGHSEEAYMHRKFAALRVTGEWFRAEPELLEHIDGIRAKKKART
jgi:hypothetical protein